MSLNILAINSFYIFQNQNTNYHSKTKFQNSTLHLNTYQNKRFCDTTNFL